MVATRVRVYKLLFFCFSLSPIGQCEHFATQLNHLLLLDEKVSQQQLTEHSIEHLKSTVLQAYYATQHQPATHELINFKFWLTTLMGVLLAIVFALIGSIFAIINFVMTPRAKLMGPVGLVIWNAAACK